MSSREYTVGVVCGGIEPRCQECGSETRYIGFSFKRFCKRHASLGFAAGGRVGGMKKKTWNKGKTKIDDQIIARMAASFVGSGNPFFGRQHSEATKSSISETKKLSIDELSSRITARQDLELLDKASDGSAPTASDIVVRCRACSLTWKTTIRNVTVEGQLCSKCNPSGSVEEERVAKFVESLGLEVIRRTRSVISPMEIDVWVPHKRVGIEYHGLFWHSGGIDKDHDYARDLHRRKFLAAQAAGVRLVQLFSDEWESKREICESILRARLGAVSQKFDARSCGLDTDVSVAEAREFLEANHLDGYARSRARLGLRLPDGRLAMVLALRVPVQKRYGNVIEYSRMACLRDSVVRGGASRLIAASCRWALANGFTGILTYADLRLGTGEVYASNGFRTVGDTGICYWYTDGRIREDRFKYRAQLGIPEVEVARAAGVRQVHGPGSRIYLQKFEDRPLQHS